MLPNIVTIICSNCQEDMHYGFFGRFNDYLGKYAACPFCDKRFDFGLEIKKTDRLYEYKDENDLSRRELLVNNSNKFFNLYKNFPMAKEAVGNKKISSLWWFSRLSLKREVGQKLGLYAKLKDWRSYLFYKDLFIVLDNKKLLKKQPVFDDKELNVDSLLTG